MHPYKVRSTFLYTFVCRYNTYFTPPALSYLTLLWVPTACIVVLGINVKTMNVSVWGDVLDEKPSSPQPHSPWLLLMTPGNILYFTQRSLPHEWLTWLVMSYYTTTHTCTVWGFCSSLLHDHMLFEVRTGAHCTSLTHTFAPDLVTILIVSSFHARSNHYSG